MTGPDWMVGQQDPCMHHDFSAIERSGRVGLTIAVYGQYLCTGTLE